ncbi:putative benzoate 4-monooxygenase cytochrome P450 [Melanomma pulvis-pyrius CBS 109.77]|uniref:Putative benzoate 4-monooxygenase cytochrome P450 n=1 Tax=Melanomma pulvis-pyrius CBS 109.77 TaxID=1314802 RepID=A0A6A6XJS5_9PLEO|nr:putative benzoate 4-monooxygenase cytochrome P450 [Melanomma pulvis-pyrius CBS 109.77]
MTVSFNYRPLSTAFTLGIFIHSLLLKNVELELYLPHFFAASTCAITGLYYAHLLLSGLSVTGTLLRTAVEGTSFTIGLFTSMVVYRLFFHRIRKFPGPFWARVSRFYALYLSAKNVQYHVELDKLRKQYGDFFRTGPREICVVRKSAVPLILGTCLKSTWYNQISRKPEGGQLTFSRDPDDHRRRKRAWDRGFSIKALATYQPRIKSKVDQLVAKFRKTAGDPKDVTAWTMMLAFDIMGEVGYSKDFGSVVNGEEHEAAKAIHDHMTILGIFGMTPWLLYIIGHMPGALAAYKPFFTWCANMIKEKKATWDSEKYPQDISSWLVKAVMEKDVSASPTEASLNDDARLIIIAGSDTSATANACTLYFLAKHPHVLKKLQENLDAIMPNGAQDWSYDKIKSVVYLDDIINESLRLKPPLITGGYRVTPADGLQIDEVYIPGDVNVFVPFQLIQTDERYWQKPFDFIPERWNERKEEMGTDETLLVPFSGGVYKCPGNHLAMMSMRTTISSIVQQFDVAFAPGETGETFDTGSKDVFTTVLPPLQLQFTLRKS